MTGAEIVVAVVVGVAAGILSAAFGVGGGIVMVPLMVLVLGRSQHVAEGTSLLVIVPTAIAGVVSHARRGLVDFRAALWVAVGGMSAAIAGAALALTLSSNSLQAAFGTTVVLVGLTTVGRGMSSLRRERSGTSG